MPETQEPVILWCGRFSKSDGYGTVSKNHLKGLRSIGARVAAYDVDLQRLVGPPPPVQLEVTRQASAVEIKPRDERIPLTVIYHERPDHYTRLKVNGRARFIGHSVFETDRGGQASPAASLVGCVLLVGVDDEGSHRWDGRSQPRLPVYAAQSQQRSPRP